MRLKNAIEEEAPAAPADGPPAAAPRVLLALAQMAEAGGKEHVVAGLAGELARTGAPVSVVCLGPCGRLGEQLTAQGVRAESVRTRPGWDLGAVLRLRRVLKEFRPDVINVHDRWSLPYVALANRLWVGRCLVLTCHGLLLETTRARLMQRLATRWVDGATAVSDQAADQYARLLGLRGRVRVIPNGVRPVARRDDLRQSIREQLALSQETLLFLAAGNVKPEKGYDVLLEACDILHRRRPDRAMFLAVAGAPADAACFDRLNQQVRRLDLEGLVRFLGFRVDTQALYSAADALVLPSRTEGLPMVLLEAMSAGLPVVASAVGGMPKVVSENQAGLLVPPGVPEALAAAMGALLDDPDLRRRLGERAADLVGRRYSAAGMAREYLAAYAQADRARAATVERARGFGVDRPGVLMLAPAPPATGGMVTAVENLLGSGLSAAYRLDHLDTGKRTPPDRPLAAGIAAQVRLLAGLVLRLLAGRGRIVHIHTCSGLTFWRDCLHMLTARLCGAKVVWHVHGGRFADFAAAWPVRQLVRLAFSHAGAVIVLGEEWVRRLRPLAPRARWAVVPNGVPVPPEAAAADHAEPTFLFLGHLVGTKGTHDLVRAAALAAERGFPGRVHLAGAETAPGQAEEIQRLIEQLHAPVRLVGVLTGQVKADALLSADALVLPSHSEALPLAVLEGMAAGLPVLATRVGQVPQVVTDGVEGLLVEPGDVEALAERMLVLAGDRPLRRRMGRAGRARIRQWFSLEAMAAHVAAIYRQALREAP